MKTSRFNTFEIIPAIRYVHVCAKWGIHVGVHVHVRVCANLKNDRLAKQGVHVEVNLAVTGLNKYMNIRTVHTFVSTNVLAHSEP